MASKVDATNTAASGASISKQEKLGILRVGTAGWTKTSWRGPFYNPGTKTSGEAMLNAYQQYFSSVENNGTCHKMPSSATVANWKAACGKGFVMSPKMVKYVTHNDNKILSNNKDSESTLNTETIQENPLHALRVFCDNIAGLGEHLGPILIQFPQSHGVQVEELRAMSHVIHGESALSKHTSTVKVAIEIRHPDAVKDPEIMEELKRLKWCLVVHPNSIGRGTVVADQRQGELKNYDLEPLSESWPVTAGSWMYVRLHGTNDEHYGRYTEAEFQQQRVVSTIVKWLRQGLDVYAYLLNDDDAAGMPLGAQTLEKLCYRELGIPVPRAPKQVRSIASFFTSTKKQSSIASSANHSSSNKKQKLK